MKKFIKIILLILIIITVILLIDTIQAKIFNNRLLLKTIENYNGENLYRDTGVLAYTYNFADGTKKTVFKWEKYAPPVEEKLQTTNTSINEKEKTKKYSKIIDKIKIELDIPNDWNYEEIKPTKNDNWKFELKIYKTSKEKNITLNVFNEIFTVCGTGLTQKNIKLNNEENASVGYYDNFKEWTFISFPKPNNNIAFLNENLENIEASEALNFVKTINITTNEYKKIEEAKLKAEGIDTKTLIRFGGTLYGKSGKMIDYRGGTEPIGKITKLIDTIYVPKYDNETNKKEILGALVYASTDNSVVLYYQNTYILFEKIEEK